MKFFFDNCISPKYVQILKILQQEVTHLQDHYKPSTPDEEWMPEIAARGWIAISFDHRITSTPQLATILRAHKLRCLFLPKQIETRPLFQQAEWLCKHWPRLRKAADGLRANGPCVYIVRQNGGTLSFDEWKKKRRRRR